ncbi:MAG TPA: ABC transporter ATP-binding protein [Verrucomicrobiae bacterium]|nr:ABC transporter ATP-binding protein [Verrucomicrobiae bacterium]
MPPEPLLTVRGLSKTFHQRRWWGGNAPDITALEDVSFTLDRGRTLAIVGPSGSGKSTLARCLAGLETPTSGEIRFSGAPVEMQLIFQQPAASLNPRFTAAEVVEEPLVIQGRGWRADRRRKAELVLEEVGLPASVLDRRSQLLSGGERQRLAIARALVVEPRLIILDESIVGLDVGLQQQIAGLLIDLQSRSSLSYILISHDLDLAAGLASEIAVMDHGRIVEQVPAAGLKTTASHPLTRELIAAAKVLAT